MKGQEKKRKINLFKWGTIESNSIPNKKYPVKQHYYKYKVIWVFGIPIKIKKLNRFEYPFKEGLI